METVSKKVLVEQIIADITTVLLNSDPETVARIANDILPEKITYIGDSKTNGKSYFEIENDEIEETPNWDSVVS